MFPGRPGAVFEVLDQYARIQSDCVYGGRCRRAGYGVARKCRHGYKVGPLFANNGSIAEALFRSLMNNLEEGSPIFLDVPEVNSSAVALAHRFNMKRVFETARMYSKELPKISVDWIFGVTTFELG